MRKKSACAAPNLRTKNSSLFNVDDGREQKKVKDTELLEIHEKRLRRILEVAVLQGAETIILGAFGCGAFENNPEVVALANRNVLKDYIFAFKNIEYAIYSSARDDKKFGVFERRLKEFINV